MTSTLEILTRARALIKKPANWTQGAYARTANGWPIGPRENAAVCYCSLGALDRFAGAARSPFAYLSAAATKLTGWCDDPAEINDGHVTIPGLTPHQAVLKMFDLAIEEARHENSD